MYLVCKTNKTSKLAINIISNGGAYYNHNHMPSNCNYIQNNDVLIAFPVHFTAILLSQKKLPLARAT